MANEAPKTDGQLPKGSSKLDFIPLPWKRDIMRLKMRGKSNEYIAKHMKKQYNYKVNPITVGTWLRRSTDLGPTKLFARKEYVNELETQYVETLHEFKKMVEFTNKVIDSMWRDAKKGTVDDKSKVLNGIRELRAQIELANSLLGTLPKDDEQLNDIAKGVSSAMKILKKEGLIKDKAVKKELKNQKREEEVTLQVPGKDDEEITIKGRIGLDFAE